MRVKALTSFCGQVTMRENQIREITDEAILSDLLAAGFVECIDPPEPPQAQSTPDSNETPDSVETSDDKETPDDKKAPDEKKAQTGRRTAKQNKE